MTFCLYAFVNQLVNFHLGDRYKYCSTRLDRAMLDTKQSWSTSKWGEEASLNCLSLVSLLYCVCEERYFEVMNIDFIDVTSIAGRVP